MPTTVPVTSPTKTASVVDTLSSGQYLIVSVMEGFASDGLTPVNSLSILGVDGRLYGQLATYEGGPGALSHNQNEIAYLADDHRIMALDVRTGERQLLAELDGLRCSSPISWSNDDRALVFSCEGRVYLLSVDAGSVEEMTVASKKAVWVDPTWSPDGRFIAFEHLPGFPQSSPDEGIYIVDTSCLQDLSICVNVAQGPFAGSFQCGNCMHWSPDGRFLAFTGAKSISILDTETGRIREIKITDSDYDPQSLAWSPDGQWIAYTTIVLGDDPQIAIFLVSADGKKVMQLGDMPRNKDKTITSWMVIR
jgi:Tol biopolymer transport system component